MTQVVTRLIVSLATFGGPQPGKTAETLTDQIVTFNGGLAVTAIQLSTLFTYQFARKSSWCYFPMLFVS